ncbi:MAG: hypothetical protein RL638_955 [Bacteroidota bacterium]|jgi:hypothetical protein
MRHLADIWLVVLFVKTIPLAHTDFQLKINEILPLM